MMPQQPIGAIVLAAGTARRFGSPKQLAVVAGRTLLERVLETAQAAGLRPVAAVVPVWLTRPAAMTDPALRWVRNPDPGRGMSHSLRLGLAALGDEVAAVVILLGDQPEVGVELIRRVIAARGDRSIVATVGAGVAGPPLLLEHAAFGLIEEITGDQGLRSVIAGHPDLVHEVGVPSAPIDVDTPDDLARLRRRLQSGE